MQTERQRRAAELWIIAGDMDTVIWECVRRDAKQSVYRPWIHGRTARVKHDDASWS